GVSDGLLPSLGKSPWAPRFHFRAVRRKLHGGGLIGRRSLHRRPLSNWWSTARSHTTTRDLLPRRYQNERAGNGRSAGIAPPAGLLSPRAGRRRCRRGRRD